MFYRVKDLEAVSEALLTSTGLSSRPNETCTTSDHEGVGTLSSSSRKYASPSTSCKPCGSGPMPDWQHPVSWGQLKYVPILSRHDPQEQCQDSRRLSSCTNPSSEVCNATTAWAVNGSCTLLVPCCGAMASQHTDNERQHVAPQANNSGQPANGPPSVRHELGVKLHIFEHTSAARAAVGDSHHELSESCDDGLVLDATAFAELQYKVAALQLKAMFPHSGSRASSSHAAAADSSQGFDSLALAPLQVPYKYVSGVGLCYVGGY